MPKPDVKKIYGKIQFVDMFPNYKVQIVTDTADLNVKKVDMFPSSPGKWQIVDIFPDYKIQIVDLMPDFTVKFI